MSVCSMEKWRKMFGESDSEPYSGNYAAFVFGGRSSTIWAECGCTGIVRYYL